MAGPSGCLGSPALGGFGARPGKGCRGELPFKQIQSLLDFIIGRVHLFNRQLHRTVSGGHGVKKVGGTRDMFVKRPFHVPHSGSQPLEALLQTTRDLLLVHLQRAKVSGWLPAPPDSEGSRALFWVPCALIGDPCVVSWLEEASTVELAILDVLEKVSRSCPGRPLRPRLLRVNRTGREIPL